MSKMVTRRIGEILLQSNVISAAQLHTALQVQKQTGERLGEILYRLGFATHNDILQALSRQLGISRFDIEKFKLEIELARERGDFFTNIFGLKLSIPITELFLKLHLSENVATFMMFAVGMLGAILLLFNDWTILLGLLLLVGSYIFDYVDGQIARYYKHCSLLGAVQDRLVHIFVEVFTILFLGYWLYKMYPPWVALPITAILLFWNRYSKYIAHLHVMIYVCEFMSYPLQEREIIRENFTKIFESDNGTNPKEEPILPPETAPRSTFRDVLTKARVSSYTFNFFTIGLLFAAIADCLFLLFHLNLHIKLLTIGVFVVYYVLSILDLSYTYLFSERIYHEVRELEIHLIKNIKSIKQMQ